MKQTQNNKQIYTRSASQSNILKFIAQHNSRKKPQGIKCFPNKLFGVSEDSPLHFRGKSTIVDNRVQYKNLKSNKQTRVKVFNLKNYFSVAQHQSGQNTKNPQQNNFKSDFCKTYRTNQSSFHRTISPITQFYNKNAWVGQIQYVMGNQRSQKMLQRARSERQFRKIQTATKRASLMHNPQKPKTAYSTNRAMNNFLGQQRQKLKTNLIGSSTPYKIQMQTRPQSSLLFLSTTKKLIDQSQCYEQKQKKNFETDSNKFNINYIDWNPKGFTVNHLNWNPKSQPSFKTKLEKFQSYINQE